jgi:GT2 family glycosyltransferase
MGKNSSRDNEGIQTSLNGEVAKPDISICIVTYKARDFLQECLRSIEDTTRRLKFEVIVVDNGSQDGTIEFLKNEHPTVSIVQNEVNAGFTRPMNQALHISNGRFLLQLNPDTVVLQDALDKLVGFMDAHSDVGICGPKVLNRDHTLQKSCRRGESRPWAVLSHFLGLANLFPEKKRFGEYQLTYMDEDETHQVAGVAGSCMLIRRNVIDRIGYLDERFFAYQEDADLCFRAREAGWKIYYYPESQVIHYGGQGGSRVHPYRSIYEWHRSYWIYYRKNLAKDYFFLFNWVYYIIMLIKLVMTLLFSVIRREKFAGPRRG